MDNLVALDPETGRPLWHANLGNSVTNGPITYELDGTQYPVVAAEDTLYGFAMLAKQSSFSLPACVETSSSGTSW